MSRFVAVSYERIRQANNNGDVCIHILKDTVTGVLYVFTGDGQRGGLTPLLGSDGKPMIESDANSRFTSFN